MATIIGYMYYFANGDTLPSGYLDIVSCDNSGDSQILWHVDKKIVSPYVHLLMNKNFLSQMLKSRPGGINNA